MDVARDASPEIDRLVIGVNRAVGPAHGARLRELADEIGIGSLEYLPHLSEFLLAGAAARDLVAARGVYWPASVALGRIDELEAAGLVEPAGSRLAATARLRPLLEAMLEARADVARRAWSGHDDAVAVATEHARAVAAAASPDHVVAVAHRALPEPADPYLRCFQALTSVRYVRHHDHVAAWSAQGLSAPRIKAMTALWLGEQADPGSDAVAELIDAGLAAEDPLRLTEAGRVMRDAIEADTDRRNAVSFAVLDDDAKVAFVAALRVLPEP